MEQIGYEWNISGSIISSNGIALVKSFTTVARWRNAQLGDAEADVS